MALELKNKPVLSHLGHRKGCGKKPFLKWLKANPNLGFIIAHPGSGNLSAIIALIPFQKIGKIVGLSNSFYGYTKMMIATDRYSQNWIGKFNQNRQKNQVKKSDFASWNKRSQILISIYLCSSVRRRTGINQLRLQPALDKNSLLFRSG